MRIRLMIAVPAALLLFGAATLVLVSPANAVAQAAGTTTPLRSVAGGVLIDAPFPFIAGDKHMPAGKYRITTQAVDWSVLMLIAADGSSEVAIVTTQTIPNSAPDRGELSPYATFDKHFGHYFLDQITVPGKNVRHVGVTREQAKRVLAKLNLEEVALQEISR